MAFWGTQRIRNLFVGDSGTKVQPNAFKITSTAVATAGNATYTAAAVVGGMIERDCTGGSRTDVTPTAAAILALMPNTEVGGFINCVVRNTSDANETITITAGSDVTLTPASVTVGQAQLKEFKIVKTSATTVTFYSMGLVAY